MKTTALAAAALILSSGIVSASPPEPAFHPYVGSKKSSHAKDEPAMRSPQAQTIDAPIVSETRAVIAADGSLDIKCREVPNPRRRDPDSRDVPGPRR